MTDSDKYCLRLNEFEGNVKVSWKEIETDKDFCDVTLACEDKQIKTHRLIISSFSPVLRNILKFNQAQHQLIYLRRVSYRNLQNLLRFMYQGEVDVAEVDLHSFLEVAEDLSVKGLCENNTDHFESNADDPLQYSDQNNHPNTKRKKTRNTNDVIDVGAIVNETDTKTIFNKVTSK